MVSNQLRDLADHLCNIIAVLVAPLEVGGVATGSIYGPSVCVASGDPNYLWNGAIPTRTLLTKFAILRQQEHSDWRHLQTTEDRLKSRRLNFR